MAQLHVNVQTFPSSEVSKDESTVFIREGSYAVVTFGIDTLFKYKFESSTYMFVYLRVVILFQHKNSSSH